jgi:hypothetical protein
MAAPTEEMDSYNMRGTSTNIVVASVYKRLMDSHIPATSHSFPHAVMMPPKEPLEDTSSIERLRCPSSAFSSFHHQCTRNTASNGFHGASGPEIWTFPSRLLPAGEGGRQTRNPRLINFHRPVERVSLYHRAAPRDTRSTRHLRSRFTLLGMQRALLLEQLRESLQPVCLRIGELIGALDLDTGKDNLSSSCDVLYCPFISAGG